MKRVFFGLILILSAGAIGVHAQDTHFTQFYSNPLYLGPSFAGGVPGQRAVANYRNQWMGVPKGFHTYGVSWDYNMSVFHSGFGLIAQRDQAGAGNYGNTRMGTLYSYDFTPTPDIHLRPGLGFYIQQISINFFDLTFGDQLALDPAPPTSLIYPGKSVVWDIDVSSSLMMYSYNTWVGFTWDHMLKPVNSFYNDEARTPFKFSLYGGYRYITKGFLMSKIEQSITGAFNFRVQGEYKQLDLGLYFMNEPLSFGFWWRGMPKGKVNKRIDALAFMVGYKFDNLSVGYSYDFTISRLGIGSGGSHEISLAMTFKTVVRKRWKALPCPTF
ncbi:PorP/SprF family type IX secretion system membrane protein [Tenuifilum osseticum]|uniref:PorP/SprF family type IX secretion system membrane protein n=1 Tax=Tenuifilum osseticum TaxID=3374723 RepID=UPI0034E40E0B